MAVSGDPRDAGRGAGPCAPAAREEGLQRQMGGDERRTDTQNAGGSQLAEYTMCFVWLMRCLKIL